MTRVGGPARLRLPSGLHVLLEEHAGADVAAVQLWVGVGARHEAGPEAGFSHFIEHLLFKGTPARGPGVIDRTISALGGEMNAATSQDFTYYHVVVPARHVRTALDVLGDAARHAAFDATELERERQVVLEEIRRAEDDPGASLWRLLARHHFGGHPYACPVLGTPATIGAASRENLVGYFRRHYRPGNASVVVIGPGARASLLPEIERAFEPWPEEPPAGASAGPGPGVMPRLIGRHRVEERRPLRETYLALAWRAPAGGDPDVYAVDLLASVLGQGRTSRLYQSLREDQRLASSIRASYYPQRDTGTVIVSARTTREQASAVEAAVLAEVGRLSGELCDPAELERACTAVDAGYAFGRETAEGVAYAYGSAQTVWTLEYELTYLDRIHRVTREDVRAAARRYLEPGRLTVAVLAAGENGGASAGLSDPPPPGHRPQAVEGSGGGPGGSGLLPLPPDGGSGGGASR